MEIGESSGTSDSMKTCTSSVENLLYLRTRALTQSREERSSPESWLVVPLLPVALMQEAHGGVLGEAPAAKY